MDMSRPCSYTEIQELGKHHLLLPLLEQLSLPFVALNATKAGKKDVEDVVADARITGKVILFLDEIHRFNKLQQDTLFHM